jgi:penicillin-insensitive murein endopeptidase
MAARSISDRPIAFVAAVLLAVSVPAAAANPGLEDWSKPPRAARGEPRIFGGPAAGCIAGAVPLASDGVGYQTIRNSRNRHWGHPQTVRYMTELGQKLDRAGFPPIYVGDMSQPRGGPMAFGHASHQTGLDVDIWFSLLPKAALPPAQREQVPLPWLVTQDQTAIDRANFESRHIDLLRFAAEDRRVDRIFVHWQIKKHLCQVVKGDRRWMNKIRAWWGHAEHFHVRLACPSDSPACLPQAPLANNDGCGEELNWWLTVAQEQVRGQKPAEQMGPPRPQMPAHCATVYRSP